MNKKIVGVSLLGGLVLGVAATGVLARAGAPTTPAAPSAPLAQSAPAFDPSRARLENERNTVSIVQQYEDGLVYISTRTNPRPAATAPRSGQTPGPNAAPQDPQQMQEFMRRFFGNVPQGDLQQFFSTPPQTRARPSGATGSGFFIDARGFILTNYHVVDGADSIKVRLNNNKKEYTAKVVGTAADYDLALLKADVPANLVKPMKLGDSDALQVGQKTIALGAPFGLDFSVTEGIVSAVGRTVPLGARDVPQKAIQTDAAINPGNSGGPLLNSAGEVIGINSMILSPSGSVTGEGQFAGVGFAIPINVARALLPKLESGARLTTPLIGIRYTDLSDLDEDTRAALKLPESGLLVQEVTPNSPAAKAGLKAGTRAVTIDGAQIRLGGDIITKAEGKSLEDADLRELLLGKAYGDTVKLEISRDGKPQSVGVTLFQMDSASR